MQGQTDKSAYPKSLQPLTHLVILICVDGQLRQTRQWSRCIVSEQDGIKSHAHSASASSTDLGTKQPVRLIMVLHPRITPERTVHP